MTSRNRKASTGRFGLSISILNRAAHRYFQCALEPYGLGPGQQAYLMAILPGELIVQDELAGRLKVDKANVTRAVRGLQELGYIDRIQDGADRRCRLVSLTDRGAEVRLEVESSSARWLKLLSEGVEEAHWALLEDLLDVVVRNAVHATDESHGVSSDFRRSNC